MAVAKISRVEYLGRNRGDHASLCVNGHKKSYCGYVWSRVEI